MVGERDAIGAWEPAGASGDGRAGGGVGQEGTYFPSVSRPALQTCSSCGAVPPLQPMAPMI